MSRPVPKPGILDIAPYVAGKSGAGQSGRVFKLSANETPFGPSPKAIEIYRSAGLHLEGLLRPSAAAAIGVFLKLVLMPVLGISLALWFGLSGQNLIIVTACSAIPGSWSSPFSTWRSMLEMRCRAAVC